MAAGRSATRCTRWSGVSPRSAAIAPMPCARRGTAAPAHTWSSWRRRRPPGRTTSRPPTTCGSWARPTELTIFWRRSCSGCWNEVACWMRAPFSPTSAIRGRCIPPGQRGCAPSRATRRSPTATLPPRSPPTAPARPSPSGWRRPIQQRLLGSATSRSATTGSATCWWSRGSWTTRSPPTAPARPSPSGWRRPIRQRLLAARPLGQPRQARQRAGGAGAAGGRARRLPRRPGHRRAAGGGRSEQRRLAARPLGQPRPDRRRAGGAGAAGRGARRLPRRPGDPSSGWRRPI